MCARFLRLLGAFCDWRCVDGGRRRGAAVRSVVVVRGHQAACLGAAQPGLREGYRCRVSYAISESDGAVSCDVNSEVWDWERHVQTSDEPAVEFFILKCVSLDSRFQQMLYSRGRNYHP